MSNIVMLLLTNGDEVFGKLTGESERGIDLDDAMLITYTAIDGVPNIIFRKYCTYTNNFDIFFKREHIVAKFTDIREEILKSYQMTVDLYTERGLPDFNDAADEYLGEFDLPEVDEHGLDEDSDDYSYLYANKKKTVH